jgi:sugar phosphate isomerase/epimerase
MTSTDEAAAVVRAVAHPAIRLQLDLGTVATNGEPLAELLAAHGGLVGHVHLSEPGLAPLGTAGSPHAEFAAAMRGARLPRPAVIEMLAVEPERRLATIDAALAHAVALFGESAS